MRFIDRGLLIEIGKRTAAQTAAPEAQRTAEEAAAQLRSIFADHPKQAAFFRRDPLNRKRATTKTRRAGATAGGVREYLARAIEQPGWRGTYVTTTSKEAHDRAWSNDTKSGFAQVLRQLGERSKIGIDGQRATVETVVLGGVIVEIRVGDLVLEFSNGSQIELYGVNTLARLDIKRGNAKHAFWVDEAQNFPNLDVFFKEVVTPAIAETVGEVWITGTPGRDCAGFFYEITGDDESEVAGWTVHVVAAVDNPFFGHIVDVNGALFIDDNIGQRHGPYETRADAEQAEQAIRWENAAGREIRENSWKIDDANVQREFFGKWVKSDARFVFPVHAIPDHVLLYAPQRLRPNGYRAGHAPWLDMDAALADLPINRRARRAYQWMFAIGADFGYHPDPFALVVWAFTHELPDVFELFSWKQTKVNTDDQGQYMKMLFDGLPNVVSFVGDVDGKKDDVEVWMNRLALPIEPAKKHGKNMLEEMLAGDIRKGAVHFRGERHGKRIVGSPLLTEMQHLVYLPTKPGKPREVDKHRKVAGVEHGDHACFVAGTMIATPDGARAIETLRPGDVAITRLGPRPVTAAWCTGDREIWGLTSSAGHALRGTADHPIWVGGDWRAWVPLHLVFDEPLHALDGTQPTADDVRWTPEIAPVYNITVADAHEYFANGILVSNCDAARYSFADLTHFLHRDSPPPDDPAEAGKRQAEAYVAAIDKAEERRRREQEAEEAAWGPGPGASTDPYDEVY